MSVTIAVMGATGTGKTTFVNLLSGSHLPVGEGLRSCTPAVQLSDTFKMSGRDVTLIDTPGFDDTIKTDTEILKLISSFLADSYRKNTKLSGVIYMHRISDVRVGGIARRNFGMFRSLCGESALHNVLIVTNMWDQFSADKGAARERELAGEDAFFKPVLEKGAHMLRHTGTLASAQAIVQQLLDNQPVALQNQREIVDEHLAAEQTAAAAELRNQKLAAEQARHEEELRRQREAIQAAARARELHRQQELEQARRAREEAAARAKAEQDRARAEREQARLRDEERHREILRALEIERVSRAEEEEKMQQMRAESERLARKAQAAREAHAALEARLHAERVSELQKAERKVRNEVKRVVRRFRF